MTDLQCNELSDLHLNDEHESVSVGKSLQCKLNEIKSDYESIFSWDIYNRTGNRSDLISNIIEKIEEKCDIYVENENHFILHRFYYKLITSFEYYNSANYTKSLSEIEGVIKSLDSCTFDDSYKQYKNSFNHIARSTYAYISLSMNIDPKKIFDDIVPISDFTRDEKAAICAIKAYVFMEYAPIGNDIALEYADEARGLSPAEPEWIIVWLVAKGRVRRYFQNLPSMPDESEINAADILLKVKNQKVEFLMQASNVYLAIAQNYQKESVQNSECIKYFRRAAEIMTEAVMLGKNDIAQLSFCFSIYVHLPGKYRSQPLIDEMIEKLQNVNYYYVNLTLGTYYFKVKDYEKAKEYFSRGMISGTFYCTIQLLKVECYLQPVEQFPFIQTLNMIYDVFVSTKRRLMVLAQILMYYCYFDNSKEIMRYLKLYMDQDISDELKKLELTKKRPLFKYPGMFQKGFNFLDDLTTYLEQISHHCWDMEEKKINVDTLNRFNKMRLVVTTKDDIFDTNKKYIRENNEYNERFNKQPQNEKDQKSSWLKNQDSPLTRQLRLTDETIFHENSEKNVRGSSWRFNKEQNYKRDEKSSWIKKQDQPSTSQSNFTDKTIFYDNNKKNCMKVVGVVINNKNPSDGNLSWFKTKQNKSSTSQTEPIDETINQ